MPLVVIPTPIGNLGDITLRALDELRAADLVLCEDTKHSGPVLEKWGVTAPRMSYQKFNERARIDGLLARLAQGNRIALISDAGTPGISDPGALAIAAAIEAGHDVDVLPGATAFVPALLLSGLPPQPFAFLGFLPDGSGDRKRELERWALSPATLILYLSPHKAARHLTDVLERWGDRRGALVREISKIHQEARRGTLSGLLASVEGGVKGELVLVVAGASETTPSESFDWKAEARSLRDQGLAVKEIAARLAERGVSKNETKAWLIGSRRS